MTEAVCFFFCLFFFLCVCAKYTFLNRISMVIENSMNRSSLNAISPLGLQSAGHFGVEKRSSVDLTLKTRTIQYLYCTCKFTIHCGL